MAYCGKCGAYIPDGQSQCLACGYDPNGKNQQSSGSYSYEQQRDVQEEARRQEEERLRQEQERRQRQEAYRRSAEAEFARRQQEKSRQERQAWDYVNSGSHPYSREGNVNGAHPYGMSGRKTVSKNRNKILSALSYLGVLFVLPFLVCPEDQFARFHAKQGMILFVFNILVGALGKLTTVGWVFTLFNLYCIYKGMTGALAGNMEELPIIGKFMDRIG